MAMKSLPLHLILCSLLLSCSTPRPEGKTEAEILYKEAQGLVESRRYLLAIEKLNTIRSKHPYSYFATHAELLGADVLFAQENYAEAAAAYIVFKDFHPKHQRLPYVIWRIGESFFNQLPSTHDRDLTSGMEAIKYYQELIRLYPKSEHVSQARERIDFCQKQFELKERYVADFYYKTNVYDSARFRYLKILDEYRHQQDLRDHSMVRIVYASAFLGGREDCFKYYNLYKTEVRGKDFQEDLKKAHQMCQNAGKQN